MQVPPELKDDLVMIADKIEPYLQQVKDQADKIPEKAHELAAKVQPAAEQLGDKIEQGAHKVGMSSESVLACGSEATLRLLNTSSHVVLHGSLYDVHLSGRRLLVSGVQTSACCSRVVHAKLGTPHLQRLQTCPAHACPCDATRSQLLMWSIQVAEEAVPQAEKAAKTINQQADKVADNLEPMADKASQRLQQEAKQISKEGPEAADKLQGQVDDIASRVAKGAKPQADKAAQLITGFAQGIKETAEPTAKVFVFTFWLPATVLCRAAT